jgi:hypothetical protein
MTTQGVVLIDILCIALLVFVLNLVRTKKLNAGYGLLWSVSIAVLMITISFPRLLGYVTKAVGAVFPVSALSLIAFAFIFLLLIFFSMRLSALSNQLSQLIQTLAINELLEKEGHTLGSNQNKKPC